MPGAGIEWERERVMNIRERLCNYDQRNPTSDYIDWDDPDTPKAAAEGCACDNCFYGRHALADALLDAWVRIDELIENNAEALKEMEKIGWPCMLSELPALYVEIADEATALRNEVAALQGI